MTKDLFTKITWWLFYLMITVTFIHTIFLFRGTNSLAIEVTRTILIILPVAITIIHALITLSPIRGISLLLLAAVVGTYMETQGLKSGVVFGGQYVYSPKLTTLFQVPISVIFYWAVFIYLGYTMTNSLITWLGKNKPHVLKGNFINILPLVLLDILTVVSIDLFMDPLESYKGTWQWINGGAFFGVPLGNFVGWAIVVTIVTSGFRTFEFFAPLKPTPNTSLSVIPILAYILIAVALALSALSYNLYSVAIVGLAFMLPVGLINLIMYTKWQLKKNVQQPSCN